MHLFFVVCLGLTLSTVGANEKAEEYLARYGYLNGNSYANDGARLTDALKQYQRFAHIPVTGVFDSATEKQMAVPRCGRPDHDDEATAYKRGVWSKHDLTYKFLTYTKDMSDSSQRQTVVRGMQFWKRVTPLTFAEDTTDNANIKIGFYTGSHGGPYHRADFDGKGNVLAHATFPEHGALHFDDDEYWTTGTGKGTNLDWVSIHELGHNLGLSHSDVKGAIMWPYYKGEWKDLQLHGDDQKRIMAMYPYPQASISLTIEMVRAELRNQMYIHETSTNDVLRNTVYNYLNNKYPGYSFSVAIYNDVQGFEKHTFFGYYLAHVFRYMGKNAVVSFVRSNTAPSNYMLTRNAVISLLTDKDHQQQKGDCDAQANAKFVWNYISKYGGNMVHVVRHGNGMRVTYATSSSTSDNYRCMRECKKSWGKTTCYDRMSTIIMSFGNAA